MRGEVPADWTRGRGSGAIELVVSSVVGYHLQTMFILYFNMSILFCCTFLLLNGHFSCKNMEQLQATENIVKFSICRLKVPCLKLQDY